MASMYKLNMRQTQGCYINDDHVLLKRQYIYNEWGFFVELAS